MPRIIRIADWGKHFECSQSRHLKTMAWVPIRIKLYGDGYTELLNHPNGAAHFGTWIALVELGGLCEPRGTLIRGNGKPHDAESLSRITRIPEEILTEAIPRLLNIGWLEHETEAILQDAVPILQDAVPPERSFVPTLQDITVQDKTVQSCASDDARLTVASLPSIDEPPFGTTELNAFFQVKPPKPARLIDGLTADQDGWFTTWWAAYWLHKAKKEARRAFGKHIKTAARFTEVMTATQTQSAEMLAREPRHRPHGATWLNGERWSDETAADVPAKRTEQDAALDKAYAKSEQEKGNK